MSARTKIQCRCYGNIEQWFLDQIGTTQRCPQPQLGLWDVAKVSRCTRVLAKKTTYENHELVR